MRVIFRVDASTAIGTGHVMRCLSLAESLRARGAQADFVCRRQPGDLIELIEQRSFAVAVLPGGTKPPNPSDDYGSWLGASQAEDADQTIRAFAGTSKPDWIVADHYGLGWAWESRVQEHVSRLLVIDDLGHREHLCDILLDQNFRANAESLYPRPISRASQQLLGPRFALLDAQYRDQRRCLGERAGSVENILIFFGGTDADNVTGMALEALSSPELSHLRADVVVGANNPHYDQLKTQARPGILLHHSLPSLSAVMSMADFAIGAGGTTTWERMVLGLPALVVAIADNQEGPAQALASASLIFYAGRAAELSAESLRCMLTMAIADPVELSRMAKASAALVDGLGTLRLVEAMFPTPVSEVRLRPACLDDMLLYFQWANDVTVRRNAINESQIDFDTHRQWYQHKLADPNCHLLVMEAHGLPVGQIRFDKINQDAWLSYSLEPFVRGRGWGSRLIQMGVDFIQQADAVTLHALVKLSNEPSAAALVASGFCEVAADEHDSEGLRSFQRSCRGVTPDTR